MGRVFWRYFRRKDGATAVEFSLVAAPFVFMLIGLVEMTLMFASQSLLQGSTMTAARMIRTGELQQMQAGNPEEEFRQTLCAFAGPLIPCNEIEFQVISVQSFEEADNLPPAQFDADGNLQNTVFDPGDVNDVVLIRVAYRYPITTPLFQPVLTNNGDGNRIMMSTVVLQTEPYEFEEA